MKKSASIVLAAVMLLSTVLFTAGCSSTIEVDLSKYVSYTGFSGFASMAEKPLIKDYDDTLSKLKKSRNEAREDDDDSAYEEAKQKIKDLKSINKALALVKFKLVKGENGKLANGDKIKIKAKYNEKKLERYEIKFKADEFEVKVNGLEEKEVIDAFSEDHFKPEFSGLDGDGSCYIKSYEDNDKDVTVYYSLDKSSSLCNGDKIKVTATIYNSEFVLKDSEGDGSKSVKEITVSGLGEIPQSLNGIDTSSVDEKYLEEIKENAKIEEDMTDKGYSFKIYGDDYRYATLKILKAGDIEVARKIYGYKNSTDGKSMVYAVIYSQDVEVKVVNPSYSSKLKKDAIKKTTAYYLAYKNSNLMVSENKLIFRDEEYNYISTSLGFETADAAAKDLEDYYESYEFSTVTEDSSDEETTTETATEPETETTEPETTTESSTETSTTETATETTTEPTTKAEETKAAKETEETTKATKKSTKKSSDSSSKKTTKSTSKKTAKKAA